MTEFWNLPQEDFDACDPLQWWLGSLGHCTTQFPQLYHIVHYVLILDNYLYLSPSYLLS